MEISGDAQATGMSEAQAAEAFERLLAPEGDSGTDEPLKKAPPEKDEAAESEDEPDEQSEGAEEEDQSEDNEDTDDAPEEPDLIPVKIDGEEVRVTLDELKAGYSRTKDYTRKTMALAENVKAFEAEKATLASERDQYRVVLGHWEQQLSTPLYDPQETEALRAIDPGEYAARMAEEQDRQNRLQANRAEQERLTKDQAKEQQGAHQQALVEMENNLLDAVPEWKADPVKAKAGLQIIWDYAATHGYSPTEVLSEPDHRTLLILRDAAAYRALKAKAPETRAKVEAVKTAKPGAAATVPPKVTEVTRAKQRLAKTGRIEDAEAAFTRLLGG